MMPFDSRLGVDNQMSTLVCETCMFREVTGLQIKCWVATANKNNAMRYYFAGSSGLRFKVSFNKFGTEISLKLTDSKHSPQQKQDIQNKAVRL
jgi:hypothetical protein